jgi:hypothetical protein
MKLLQRKFKVRSLSVAAIVLTVLMANAIRSYGIEGLRISVQQGTNIVLGWPSCTNETYIIQYCTVLAPTSPTNPWQTLTDYYAAFAYTNWTTYTISNAIPIPIPGGGGTNNGGSGPPPLPDDATMTDATADATAVASPQTLAEGESVVPPSPWIPATLPNGAILTASAAYIPLPPPPQPSPVAYLLHGRVVSPDGGTNGGGSGISDPGFYLVVRDGVHCVGLTNGSVVSGTVTIPLEIAVEGDPIQGVALYVDGNAASGGLAQLTNGLWTFQWDSTTVPNGLHQLSAEVVFYDYDTFPDVTNSLSITVSNAISWPFPFSQVFGQGVGIWVNVQSALAPAYYWIAVYGSQTNYLGYFSGYTPNGSISFTWDLTTNANSPPMTDPTFRLDYYVATSNSPPAAPAASTWAVGEAPWPATGFVIACAALNNNEGTTAKIQTMVQDGVVNILSGPYTLAPAANIPYGTPWTLD